jgi:hypothetical protein
VDIFCFDIIYFSWFFMKDQNARITIMDILNHPRILRCVDENQIIIPNSLRERITSPSQSCAKFALKYFLFILIYSWMGRCGHDCYVANMKKCNAGHMACMMCVKDSTLDAKEKEFIIYSHKNNINLKHIFIYV